MESTSTQSQINKGSKKIILHTIGYFFFGTIWIFFNAIPSLPLGLLVGFIRIYQRKKNEVGLRWHLLLIALVLGALLGAGVVPGVYIGIFNFSINT